MAFNLTKGTPMSNICIPHDNNHDDQYGFRWGPVRIIRYAIFDRPTGLCRVIGIDSDKAPRIQIYVSPTGRSVRVYRDGKELT